MRDVLIAGWLAVLLVLVPARSLAGDDTRSRAQEALDATKLRIGIAETFVAQSPELSAQKELSAALQEQARARSAFGSAQYLIAVSTTLGARDHADRAIAMVRSLPDPDHVQEQVERTRDLLERATERIDIRAHPEARATLQVAGKVQQRAEDAMAESRYLAALQLTTSARDRVAKLMRSCNLDESLSDSAARALRRTDLVLSRARESVGSESPPAVRDLLGRAHSTQAQAVTEARLERYESALRLTHGARSLARRAIRPERMLRGPAGR
jgi:hypothetical protein